MKNGFGILEALLGTALIAIAMFFSISSLRQVMYEQKNAEKNLSFFVARNEVLRNLNASNESPFIDTTGWLQTATAAANTEMSCLAQMDHTTLADRDCLSVTSTNPLPLLSFYNVAGEAIYDFRNSSTGFSPLGPLCNTYSSTANDPQCPLRLDVRWKPVCPTGATSCVNPMIQLNGAYSFSDPGLYHPNLEVLGFTVLKSNVYCPTPSADLAYTATDASVTVTTGASTATYFSGQVTSTGAVTGVAKSNSNFAPCGSQEFTFQDLGISVSPGAQPEVCIADDAGTCVFQWKRVNTGYQLSYNGTAEIYGTNPTKISLSSSSKLSFKLFNGLVQFCVDGHCYHYFREILDFPYRFTVKPTGYGTGNGLSFSMGKPY